MPHPLALCQHCSRPFTPITAEQGYCSEFCYDEDVNDRLFVNDPDRPGVTLTKPDGRVPRAGDCDALPVRQRGSDG